jgi:hypothetical protein
MKPTAKYHLSSLLAAMAVAVLSGGISGSTLTGVAFLWITLLVFRLVDAQRDIYDLKKSVLNLYRELDALKCQLTGDGR